MKNFWTKSNVGKMAAHELIKWNNELLPKLKRAEELGVEMKASKKAITLIQAEMKKRAI
jgi:hypothetical protein